MRSPFVLIVVGRALATIAVVAMSCAVGCQTPTPQQQSNVTHKNTLGGGVPLEPTPTIDPTKTVTKDDIVQIVQFWPSPPWLADPYTNRTDGFKVTIYFYSSSTERGAFVPGIIHVWMSTLEPDRRNQIKRRAVHEWTLDEADAMGFRVRKEAIMGNAYGFVLKWPKEVDVLGKEVEIVFGYERADGRVIRSAPRSFRVPAPLGYQQRPPAGEPQ